MRPKIPVADITADLAFMIFTYPNIEMLSCAPVFHIHKVVVGYATTRGTTKILQQGPYVGHSRRQEL